MNADGSDQRRVTNDSAGEYRPSFSPDGRQVVYSDDRGTTDTAGISELWAVNVDGSSPRPLTAAGQFASAAAWSPDGGTIVFSFRGPATGDDTVLWRVPAAGNSAITPFGAPVPGASQYDPDWSPDGKRVAFWRDGGDIVSVDRNGATCGSCYGSQTFDGPAHVRPCRWARG